MKRIRLFILCISCFALSYADECTTPTVSTGAIKLSYVSKCQVTFVSNNVTKGKITLAGAEVQGTTQELFIGEAVSLTAVPASGCQLQHWLVGGVVAGTELTLQYTPTADVTIQAVFVSYPVGAVRSEKAVFSVSSTKQIYFSKGNLYGNYAKNEWYFFENQYEYTTTNWMSYFLYGSGSSNTYASANLDANTDWGRKNPIINGGNVAGQWRTLSKSEWEYLFARTMYDASISENVKMMAYATVNGVAGFILLPDGWVKPTNCSLIKYNFKNSWSYTANVYTVGDAANNNWKDMEEAGAVFLPAAGYDGGTPGESGLYWTSSINQTGSSPYAWSLKFSPTGDKATGVCTKSQGVTSLMITVRLVQDK